MTVSHRATGLSAIISSGSPIDDGNFQIHPKNQLTVYGAPGTRVTVSCDTPAVFDENNDHVWSFTLTIEGKQTVGLQSPEDGRIGVFVQDDDDPSNSASVDTTFGAYKVGEGDIKAFAVTTGAPADGLVPCSLYIMTSEESRNTSRMPITKIHVSVDNGATLVGYEGSAADILLNDDFTVEVDVVNMTAGKVTATVTLPEESGPVIYPKMMFMPEPAGDGAQG